MARTKTRARAKPPAPVVAPKAPRPRRRAPLLLGLLLAAGTLLVYWQVCRFGFLFYDDMVYVTRNANVRSGLSLQNLAWSFTTFCDGNWFPLTWISLLLDSEIYGLKPAGFHVTNLLLHLANTLVVFVILTKTTSHLFRSAVVAALFALHPLHVESVAWVAERKDVLSTLFGLLSLWAYIEYAKTPNGWKFAACFLLFVCSLMSKQTLVTLPFVFLLLDYWPLGRYRFGANAAAPANVPPVHSASSTRSFTRLLFEKTPFFVVTAGFCVIALVAQAKSNAVKSLEAFPLAIRCGNAVVAYATYVEKAVFPHDLAVYYPHPGAQLSWLAVAVAAAFLLAVTVAAIVTIRRLPFVFVGWAWYLGTLVPMIGIVQIGNQQMADRYTYFPLIGLFVAGVWLVAELVPAGAWRKRLLLPVTVAMLGVLAAAAYFQVGHWQNSLTLFSHALSATTDNYFTRNQLGSAYFERHAYRDAAEQLEAASRFAPTRAELQHNLAVALQQAGRTEDAIAHYRVALALREDDPHTHVNLGQLLEVRHEYREARQHFERAAELNHEDLAAYINLGLLCLETGDNAAAISYSERALALDPNQVRCHCTIAAALRAQGHLDESIRRWNYVVSRYPNNRVARAELERTLELKRKSR